jgi:hypothetical protein
MKERGSRLGAASEDAAAGLLAAGLDAGAFFAGLGSASAAALAGFLALVVVVRRFLAPDSDADCSSTALVLLAIVVMLGRGEGTERASATSVASSVG